MASKATIKAMNDDIKYLRKRLQTEPDSKEKATLQKQVDALEETAAMFKEARTGIKK